MPELRRLRHRRCRPDIARSRSESFVGSPEGRCEAFPTFPDHSSPLSILCFRAHFREFSMFGAFGVQMGANMQKPYESGNNELSGMNHFKTNVVNRVDSLPPSFDHFFFRCRGKKCCIFLHTSSKNVKQKMRVLRYPRVTSNNL